MHFHSHFDHLNISSRILNHEFCSNNINGVKASIGGPAITHVMYADDIVLFSKATRNDAANIIKCIENIAAGLVKKSIGTNQVFSSPSTLDQASEEQSSINCT